jgi:anti-sigma B factor antagonist
MATDPAAARELQILIETTPIETIFCLIGKVTSESAPQLGDAVRGAIPAKKTIVLDLSQVAFMDSSGLGTLVSVWVSAKKAGCEIQLLSLTPRLKEFLRVTSLDQWFAVSRFPDKPSF